MQNPWTGGQVLLQQVEYSFALSSVLPGCHLIAQKTGPITSMSFGDELRSTGVVKKSFGREGIVEWRRRKDYRGGPIVLLTEGP